MNKDIKLKIEKYIETELDTLSQLSPTEGNYNETRDSIVKNINILVELLQKEDINDNNSDLKQRELDMNIKRDVELRNDRVIKILIDGATIIVPIIFYNVWMNKGFRFEETGTYTSNTFKNLFNRFKPTK